MTVRSNIGKIGAVISAAKQTANTIDYGPLRTLDVIGSDQARTIADWHQLPMDNTIIIWGVHNWGDSNFKVTK
jgi:hypothetical protein